MFGVLRSISRRTKAGVYQLYENVICSIFTYIFDAASEEWKLRAPSSNGWKNQKTKLVKEKHPMLLLLQP